jgi:hypothetical protein
MACLSFQFKKLILKLEIADRNKVVDSLCAWAKTIPEEQDPKIRNFISFMWLLQSMKTYTSQALEDDKMAWSMANNLNDSVSMKEVIKSKLAVPKKKEEKAPKKAASRKTIPKKTREAVWTKQFGSTLEGKCYCCKEKITALGTWHAGHVIPQSNGGPDTVDNLRAVCQACNQAMTTENMEDFKKRCYP